MSRRAAGAFSAEVDDRGRSSILRISRYLKPMDLERELLKGNTPTLVLAVLREAPLHGYAIAREIERRSGRSLRCKEGTLYPILHSLEREGLIGGEWQRENGARERKVYALTPAGLAALEERAQVWRRFADAVQRVIGEDGEPAERPGPRRPGTRRPVPDAG